MDKKALRHMTYGLFLLTAQEDGKDNGCIINTAVQVADKPTRISIAVLRVNKTCDMVLNTGEFNISSITTEAEFALFQRFGMQSGRDVDKFDGFEDAARAENGLYYLTRQANMYLSVKVVEHIDLGTHILFIGEVTDGVRLSDESSCTYSYYQSNIKPQARRSEKKQWVCTVCGYIYEGESVPDDFICPLCHHGKEDFVLVGGEPAPAEEPVQDGGSGGKKWVCTVCGYIHEGESAPDICPICKVPKEKFIER